MTIKLSEKAEEMRTKFNAEDMTNGSLGKNKNKIKVISHNTTGFNQNLHK